MRRDILIRKMGDCNTRSVSSSLPDSDLVFDFYKCETETHLSHHDRGLGPQTATECSWFLARDQSLKDSPETDPHDSDV